jgi:hypothetical protein
MLFEVIQIDRWSWIGVAGGRMDLALVLIVVSEQSQSSLAKMASLDFSF